jgi:hypothetical protein
VSVLIDAEAIKVKSMSNRVAITHTYIVVHLGKSLIVGGIFSHGRMDTSLELI